MAVNKSSPSRRNSISVSGHNRAHPGHRRRAHSIAPGDHLSPTARARRSLAPRKSILKVNATDDGEDRTQAMDMTGVVRFETDGSRKSLGRRVSFANHAHVRLFEVPEQNTNSTASPQSSPAAEIGSHGGANDENAYPGASSFRRNSSIRRSAIFSEGGGEESMEMDSDDTGYSPGAFFRASNAQEGVNDMPDFGFEDEGDYDDAADMDVTEAISHNIVRKRSLSLGGPRQPLGNLTVPRASLDNQSGDGEGQEKDQSFVEEDSGQSHSLGSEGDTSQPMEFTVPLVRPAKPPSEAWLALRAVTHSGNTPFIPSSDDEENGGNGGVQEMDLNDAVSRLQAARASLGLGNSNEEDVQPDSFTSTEDSFAEENSRNDDDEGNQTVNVTQLIRRISLVPSTGDSTMDVTSVYGEQRQEGSPEVPSTTPATESLKVPQQTNPVTGKPSFPTPAGSEGELPAIAEPQNITVAPQKFSFIPRPRTPATTARPPSPSKANSLPPSPKKFSANFAPPVSRPVPEKRSAAAAHIPDGRSSPAKKPSGPEKLTAGLTRHELPRPPNAPSRLSPTKIAPPQAGQGTQSEADPSKRAPLGLRRPSGYLAQRKSFGEVVTPLSTGDASQSSRPSSPGKQAMGARRKSIAVTRDADGVLPRFNVSAEKDRAGKDRVMDNTAESAEQTETQLSEPALPPQLHEVSMVIESSHDDQLPEPNPLPPSQQNPVEDSMLDVAQDGGDGSDDEGPNNSLPIGEPTTEATEQWRENVQQASSEEEEGPPISIQQFFEMTGIRFMDEITAPRRQSIHPSTLRPSRRASVDGQIPLAEYMVAMAVDVPQLELYTHVSKDLQAWIERIQSIYREAEEEALEMTPQLFQEFISADETGQAELIHQLKLIKVHNHEQAKSEWYDWKLQWVEQLDQKASKGFEHLEKDAKFLEGVIHEAQSILPGLQQEHDQLVEELEKETTEIVELEACDQDYLKELKASISEQGTELDNYRREVEEAKAKLSRIEEKLKEVQTEKAEVSASIEKTERLIDVQKNSTHVEVFRLKGELETLQRLHMVEITKVEDDLFKFAYASTYEVSTTCVRCRPVVGTVQIQKFPDAKRTEVFPVFCSVVLRMAKELVNRPEVSNSLRKIVEFVGTYWSCCSRLQLQFRLVAIKFYITFKENPSGFSVDVSILYPSVKAKAIVSFIFDVATFSTWPCHIQSMKHDVRVIYGQIQRDVILQAVGSRLKDVTPTNNHGCLLDACMEAAECIV